LAQSLGYSNDRVGSPLPVATAAAPARFREYLESSRDQPIYVIMGVQGSGTNLLSRLLTKLFGFSVMRDRSAVFNGAARLGANPTATDVEREIERFKDMVWPSPLRRKLGKHIILKTKPWQGFASAVPAVPIATGADFARVVYTYQACSLGASHIAIKSDDLWQNIHAIDQVIPNRRIILLTRDFRDNLLSISGKGFGPIEPVCAAQYVKQQLAYYTPEFRRAGAAGYRVTYEALLSDTRQLVDDLSRHFDLEPKVNLDVAIPALKFRPNKIGKWKKLSERELAWCEGILYDELIEFGYEPTTQSPVLPGPGQRLLATARDKTRRLPQKLHRLAARLRRPAGV
jgi:hypothetical protein